MIPPNCLCILEYHGIYSPTWERHPECPHHGDIDVLRQILSQEHFAVAMTNRLKYQISSMYGKEGAVTYPTIIPQPPAVRGTDYGRKAARRQENLKKYVSESGNVVVVTWAEIPDVVIDKQYALYVNGDAKAQLAGTSIVSLIELRDWLTDVIDAEVPVRLVEVEDKP